VTTRWDKCGGVLQGPVSAMLPRLKLLFSRGPPSARSPQIRPHPVTVSHLSSYSSSCLLLHRHEKAARRLARSDATITTPPIQNGGRVVVFVCLNPHGGYQIDNRFALTWVRLAVAFPARLHAETLERGNRSLSSWARSVRETNAQHRYVSSSSVCSRDFLRSCCSLRYLSRRTRRAP
jgi:hypothetical protein